MSIHTTNLTALFPYIRNACNLFKLYDFFREKEAKILTFCDEKHYTMIIYLYIFPPLLIICNCKSVALKHAFLII